MTKGKEEKEEKTENEKKSNRHNKHLFVFTFLYKKLYILLKNIFRKV